MRHLRPEKQPCTSIPPRPAANNRNKFVRPVSPDVSSRSGFRTLRGSCYGQPRPHNPIVIDSFSGISEACIFVKAVCVMWSPHLCGLRLVRC